MWPNWNYFSEIIQPFYLKENYKTKGARSISTKKLRPFKDFTKKSKSWNSTTLISLLWLKLSYLCVKRGDFSSWSLCWILDHKCGTDVARNHCECTYEIWGHQELEKISDIGHICGVSPVIKNANVFFKFRLVPLKLKKLILRLS